MNLFADARATLQDVRAVRASSPGPDAEALRTAYLDLLKLALCDLAGSSTTSVGALPDRTVMARELDGDGLRLRAAGMDWPRHGLTMVGLRRLDDLQACVEVIVADGVEGDLIEAGAWRGGAAILMRATLDTLGDDRTVVVADSFAGFPDGDPDGLGDFDFLAVSLEEVRASFARFGLEERVEFVPGFFETSLAPLAGRRWALVRLDADTYEPTREALRVLYPGLSVGGRLIVDDYGSFEGCRRAVDEFRDGHGITEPLEPVDFTCRRWRRAGEAPSEVAGPSPDRPAPPQTRARRSGIDRHVPTAAEVALRDRLAAAETEVARLRAEGLRAHLRRRLRR